MTLGEAMAYLAGGEVGSARHPDIRVRPAGATPPALVQGGFQRKASVYGGFEDSAA